MLRGLKSIFICASLFAAPVFAGTFSGYGDECNSCCNSFGVDVEFLYFKPTFDDTYFVIQNSIPGGTPNGQRLNNDLNFKPGFRIGGSYEFSGCCDGTFQAYYTRVGASQTRTVSGAGLFSTVGKADITGQFQNFTGFASSNLDCLYQRVDAFYSKHLWCDRCLVFDGFFGLEYAYLRLNEHYVFRSINNIARLNESGKTWGIGPQFGFDFNYLIWNTCWCGPGSLSLAASTSGSLLVSKTIVANQDFVNTTRLINVADENTWRIIPVMHARVGLNYATCFSCWRTSLEVGYEFTSYIRGLARHAFPDDVGDAYCLTTYYNFDVQGLYVALNVAF